MLYITGDNAVESMQEEAQTQQEGAEPEATDVGPPPEPPPDCLLALEFEMPAMQRKSEGIHWGKSDRRVVDWPRAVQQIRKGRSRPQTVCG